MSSKNKLVRWAIASVGTARHLSLTTSGRSIKVGDALLFPFTAGQQDVLEVTESTFATRSRQVEVIPLSFNRLLLGFISGFPGGCTNGMHLSLHVISSCGPRETPVFSPSVTGPGPGTRVAPSHAGSLSPPAGYAPGAAPNIPSGDPLSNALNSLPAPRLASMAMVPSSPLESTSAPGSSPARAPAGHVPAPPAPFSSPTLQDLPPVPLQLLAFSPLDDLTPSESSPLASPPVSSVGASFGPKTSACTSPHRLDLAGLVMMMLPALIFSLFLQH